MTKKLYQAPRVIVKEINSGNILAGSGMSISQDPATEPAHSKGGIFDSGDGSSSNISPWGNDDK